MSDHDETPVKIGWLRALVAGSVIVIVAILALVYVPNWILTRIHGKTRGSLVALATVAFFVLLFALLWTLRFLQRRKVI
jgi:hypothetical protein